LITNSLLPDIGKSIGDDAPPVFRGAPRKTGYSANWGRFKRHLWGVLIRYRHRFVRWRKAGVWDHVLGEISKAFDGDIVMIDSSCVRVHQHAATGKRGIKTIAAWDVPVAA
jgi:transposase